MLDNKYHRWYDSIVSKGDDAADYVEKHHILPKALGGTDDAWNLVWVLPEKHFLLHWLLIKFTEGQDYYKMQHALGCMLRDSKGERHISSWRYALAREALSIAKKKYWEDHPEGPDFEHLLKYHEDHPEAHAEHGQWMAQYYEFHPEQREARRAGALKQFETSESRENHCKVMAKYYEDHPEFGAEHSAKLLRFFEDHPEICELRSVKGSQLHEEHPELGVEHSKRMQNLYSDPEARKKTSEAVKKALAIKRGDIPDDRTLAQIRKADRQRASKLKRNGKELQCPVAQF